MVSTGDEGVRHGRRRRKAQATKVKGTGDEGERHSRLVRPDWASQYQSTFRDPQSDQDKTLALCRKQNKYESASPVTLVLRAIDALDLSWDDIHTLTPATALQIPLSVIIRPSPTNLPPKRPGFKKCAVNDFFIFDDTLGHLRLRDRHKGEFIKHPTLLNQLRNDITQFRFFLRPFFARLCLPRDHPAGGHDITFQPLALAIKHHQGIKTWQTKKYRKYLAPTTTGTTIHAKNWIRFWATPMDRRCPQHSLPHIPFYDPNSRKTLQH
ncbi:hypothetical protein BDB00DRAFT_928883 [Zychaea mexicana]|uniref:uncharacterized protein n=1 Tax=Zychaea mexicana TaxID=64656 RepID=UPI0022FDC69F|nr:uncharacterized protein BDB00DRAFT_928883 [Zychaea mexicana]KAI9493561.1 hypothetical protein BDB00DRAFT_928883 [Zychaea mexicana]